MQILSDMTYLTSRPLDSAEVLCCAALYLQCVDMRMSACNFVSMLSMSIDSLIRFSNVLSSDKSYD
jgi:hypothetical protein